MSATIRYMEAPELPVWRDFIDSRQDATFYHRPEWKEIVESSFGHRAYYLMAMNGRGVTGVLPLVHVKSALFGSILCSMPYLNFGGVVADSGEAEGALYDEAGRLMKRIGADYVELRQSRRSSSGLPSAEHKVGMYLDLDPDPEAILGSFKRRHRREVRSALKKDLEIRFGNGELTKDFYALLSRGWRDLGTPIYDRRFFEKILSTFGESAEISVVYHRGVPVATAFDGFHDGVVEGMWSYSLKEYTSLKVNYFLYWQLIKRACERGCRHYHLGRSTAESNGQRYKAKWGAQPRQLYWEYVVNGSGRIPELNVENPRYRLAIGLWRRLPVPLTRIAGPFLAKGIP
jgi:FemAB-related protein (PEP-CTERM system-associated)